MSFVIDPFGFDPTGPLDPLTAYFYVTWMRVSYHDAWADRDKLKTLVGADEIEIFPVLNGRHTEIAHIPGGRAIVVVRGTDDNSLLHHLLLDRGQIQNPPHVGVIHRLIARLAEHVYRDIEDVLPDTWTAAGHSLGGAIVDLISEFGATKIVTAGAPRVGNSTYALSRDDRMCLRLTNNEDLVPKLPPAAENVIEHYVLISNLGVTGLQTFRHWGTRVNLFADGSYTRPPEIGTTQEAANHIIQLVQTGQWGISEHFQWEYARRLRAQIPVEFPTLGDPDFQGLDVLDKMNVTLNDFDEINWVVDPRDSDTLTSLRRHLNWRSVGGSENVNPPEVPFRCE